MQKLPIVAIIGRPNVGKSTLFNRLIGERRAITSNEPGTTRDRILSELNWNGKQFILVDTAGLLVDFYGFEEKDIEKLAQKHIEISLREADVVLFVVDSKTGLTGADEEAARLIRKSGKRTILVVNKADNLAQENVSGSFAKLGFDETIAVSSITGRRTGDLLDLAIGDFKKIEPTPDNRLKIAIIGRPNVGKSTLFNIFAKREKAITSSVAGTTRDSKSEKIKICLGDDCRSFEIIDTAGFRRRGKIEVGVEKFSVFRALDSIYKADIVLLVIDSREGVTRGDAHLAQAALDKRKKILVVLNKIDLLENKTKAEIKNLDKYPFLAKNTFVAISADKQENIDLLSGEILKCFPKLNS